MTISSLVKLSTKSLQSQLHNGLKIIPNFITQKQEDCFCQEIDAHFRNIQYENDHWDAAINGFREKEILFFDNPELKEMFLQNGIF